MGKAYLNWSSGKDAAFSLFHIYQEKEYEIEKLLTTLNTDVDRVTMHGVRKELLLQQAEKLKIPLMIVEIGSLTNMEDYNSKMREATTALKSEGFEYSVFGDIFLEDLKKYREEQLNSIGLKAVFPLWKRNSKELILDFIAAGFKAIVVCVNSKHLDENFCGRLIDQDFVQDLPVGVDPCGENGEFHTFVYDGPIFQSPIEFRIGEKQRRSYQSSKNDEDNCFQDETESWDTEFCFLDLLPK